MNLIQWIKENTDIEFDILLKNTGVLEKEFTALGKVHHWTRYFPNQPSYKNTVKKILRKGFEKQLSEYDLIYANTVAVADLLPIIHAFNSNIILHVHELEMSIRQFCGWDIFQKNHRYAKKILAVSNAVSQNLVKQFNIPVEKIALCYGFIPVKKISAITQKNTLNLRQHLKIPESAFIVGGCGTMDWRKGIDLFIQTAFLLKSKPIYFVWLGGDKDALSFKKQLHDIKKMGLENRVFLISSQKNAFRYFDNFDVFFLSSREDPFPLVCLENAALGKPIICFEDAGGMPEFVIQGGGQIIPFLNLEAVTESILAYYTQPSLRKQHGDKNKTLVQAYTLNQAGPKIVKIIHQVIASNV